MRSALIPVFFAVLAVPVLAGCDDPIGQQEAILLTDTVSLAVPGTADAVPSAIDVARDQSPRLRRFPERPEDAQQWDFALRVEDGALLLRPYRPVGGGRGASIRVAGQDFDEIRLAPIAGEQYTTDPVPLEVGQTYFLRSREHVSVFGIPCQKYAKMKVVDAGPTTAELALTINEGCSDERLTRD